MSANHVTSPKPPPPAVVRFVRSAQGAITRFTRKLAPPQFALLEMVTSRWLPHAIGVVTRLGVIEQLRDGSKSVGDLAPAVGADKQALYRVMRALSREGLFREGPRGTFSLTDLSRPLLKDAPSSVRNVALMMSSEWNGRLWLHLEQAVRTGSEIFPKVFGKDLWDYLADQPEEAAAFHGAMVEVTRNMAAGVADAYDFSQFETLVDVGGGQGELLAMILRKHPRLRGIDFDLPQPLKQAQATFERHGVADRCEIIEGNMLESVPTGKDAYIMKSILHGFSDDKARHVLQLCRDAMRPNGKILVVDHVVPEPDGPYLQFLDLQMLLGSYGGRERTSGEFTELVSSAGLRLERIVETASPMSVVVAARA